MNSVIFRIVYTLFTLFMVLVAPWWMAVPLLLVGIVMFNFYVEAIIGGFLLDVLYGGSSIVTQGVFTFAASASIIVFVFIKQRLRITSYV